MTQRLRPFATKSHAIRLASEIFNVQVDASSVKELDSYYDRNFFLRGTKDGAEREFLLKILNSHNSENTELLDELHAIMLLLNKHGIPCSVPERTTSGSLFELRMFTVPLKCHCRSKQAEGEKAEPLSYHCAVRLFNFLPGKTLRDIPFCNTDLFFKIGCLAGEVDKVLKDFKCPFLEGRSNAWDLGNIEEAKRVSDAVKNPHHQKLLQNVEKSFQTFVLPKLDGLPRQCIHCDMNEANLIVQSIPGSSNYEVCGLIDFAETNFTHRVFEVAVAAAYMTTMFLEDPIAAAAHTIAGYQQRNPLTDEENELIFYLIQVRLYQSACFGTKASELHPENSEYFLYTVNRAWKVFETLAATSKNAFDAKWKKLFQDSINGNNNYNDVNIYGNT